MRLDIEKVIGTKYEMLTAEEYIGMQKAVHYFRFKCDCGRIIIARYASVQSGNTKSCGCLKHKVAITNDANFWNNKVINDKGCWVWTRGKNKAGYGRTTSFDKRMLVHRLAYIKTHGEIPDNLLVCHTCDNPPCFNPDHLFLGTTLTNAQDCVSKDRHVYGSRAVNTHLTEDDVRSIRERIRNGESNNTLVAEYGVSQATVSRIKHGKRWKHVLKEPLEECNGQI